MAETIISSIIKQLEHPHIYSAGDVSCCPSQALEQYVKRTLEADTSTLLALGVWLDVARPHAGNEHQTNVKTQ